MGKYQEYVLGTVCFLAAAVSLAAAAAICFFLFAGAVPFCRKKESSRFWAVGIGSRRRGSSVFSRCLSAALM